MARKTKTIPEIAAALLSRSATLGTIAEPSSAGYKAVDAWLTPRFRDVIAEYGITYADKRQLIMEINSGGGSASLDD